MFKTEIDKISDSSEKKIAYMNKNPFSYVVLSSLAGIYLGFGIVLIFSIGGPIAAAGGGAYLKLIMGASFGIALSLVIFAGSELFTGNNMVFAIGSLTKRVGFGPIIGLFILCFIGNLLDFKTGIVYGTLFITTILILGGGMIAANKRKKMG